MDAVRWFAGLALIISLSPPVLAQHGQSTTPEYTFAQGQNTSGNRSVDEDWESMQQDAENEAAAYNAITQASAAQEAMYKAQLAALQVKYGGGLKGTELDGSISFETTKAAKPEAMLLVNRSAAAVAEDIDLKTKGIIKACRPLLVLTQESSFSMDAALLFDLNVKKVTTAFQAATAEYSHADKRDPGDPAEEKEKLQEGNRSIQIAGAVTEGLAKLGSYFQSEYKFGPADMENFDANAVAYALAGRIASRRVTVACLPNESKSVLIPERQFVSSLTKVSTTLANLDATYIQVVGQRAASRARQDELTKAGKAQAASYYAGAVASADRAIELYTSFVTLVTQVPEAKGEPFLVRVVRQKQAIDDLEGKNPFILMVSGQAAGQYYTKKNLWTFFGGPPLYTAGAVTASYMLLEPSGAVVTSGTAASHGGYQSIRKVQRLVDGDRARARKHFKGE